MRHHILLTTAASLLISVSALATNSWAAEPEGSHSDRPPVAGGEQGGPGGEHRPPRLTDEQKKAIHDCAKQSGVDLPPPSKDGPPKLTEEQRKVVHACFDKLGIKPPPHPPQDGKGPGGPGGEGGDHHGKPGDDAPPNKQ